MFSLALQLVLAAGPGNVADGPVMAALRDEIARAKTQLALPNVERPYHIRIEVEDETHRLLGASFGALDRDEYAHYRQIYAEVRVGDATLDNSNFIGTRISSLFARPRQAPFVDDYGALRREVWLAIDDAYKSAAEAIASKRAALKTATRPEGETADFSPVQPAKTLGPRMEATLEAGDLAQRLSRASAVFKQFADVQESSVEATAVLDERYIVDSDGNEGYEAAPAARVLIRASTQADDGMRLELSVPAWAATFSALPAADALEASAKELADQLSALRKAPVVDDYGGPVLFEGTAAPELALELLGWRLSGTPPPLSEEPRMSRVVRDTDFAHRMGQRVLSPTVSVEDDPSMKPPKGAPLIGAYRVDDEGVPSQRVSLIQAGTLKTLLMSRTPREGLSASNGHGRYAGMGEPQAMVGVLSIHAAAGRGDDDRGLRTKLLKLAHEQGLDYAYVVRRLGDARAPSFALAGNDGELPPTLMYRVRADGKEELVRGARMGSFPLRSLKEIAGIGQTPVTFNTLSHGRFGFGAVPGGYLSGVPQSCLAPALLFSNVEISRAKAGEERGPYMKHPFFAGK